MTDIIEVYSPPLKVIVTQRFILNNVKIEDMSGNDDWDCDFREVSKGEELIAIAKTHSSKCESGIGIIIWDPVLKETALIDSLLIEDDLGERAGE